MTIGFDWTPQHRLHNASQLERAVRFGLFRFRSPLLSEFLFLEVLRCVTSLGSLPPPETEDIPNFFRMGFPIRQSPGQRLFAPIRRLTQPTTAFVASGSQGIHHTPLITWTLALPPNMLSKITGVRNRTSYQKSQLYYNDKYIFCQGVKRAISHITQNQTKYRVESCSFIRVILFSKN